jgi:hypothetical protein
MEILFGLVIAMKVMESLSIWDGMVCVSGCL